MHVPGEASSLYLPMKSLSSVESIVVLPGGFASLQNSSTTPLQNKGTLIKSHSVKIKNMCVYHVCLREGHAVIPLIFQKINWKLPT